MPKYKKDSVRKLEQLSTHRFDTLKPPRKKHQINIEIKKEAEEIIKKQIIDDISKESKIEIIKVLEKEEIIDGTGSQIIDDKESSENDMSELYKKGRMQRPRRDNKFSRTKPEQTRDSDN